MQSLITGDNDDDDHLASSVSIYDNLSIYETLNINNDDTDNDKESIVSNYDEQIDTSNKNEDSLDSIFNRLSLECEQTIEQCRSMIQRISSNNKYSIITSSSESLSSLPSQPIQLFSNRQMFANYKNKQQKKRKKLRKKLPKEKINDNDSDESFDNRLNVKDCEQKSNKQSKILNKSFILNFP